MIPSDLGNLKNLQYLDLSMNNFAPGPIPATFGNLRSLKYLNLLRTNRRDNIPPELGNLSRLQELDLQDNELTGSIPATLGNLSQLQELDLSDNELTGAIPATLGNLSRLQRLYLNHNKLTGAIPATLGNLSQLQVLYLNHNKLTGAIPPELGNLTNLGFLALEHNQLTGNVPRSLSNLGKLTCLSVNSNPLSGALPQDLTKLHLLFFDFRDTKLCEPGNREFQNWLERMPGAHTSGLKCDAPPTSRRIGPTGGILSSPDDMTDYAFAPGTFSTDVTVTHTPLSSGPPVLLDESSLAVGAPPAKRLTDIRHYYQVSAVNASGQPVTPTIPYTVTIGYSLLDLGGVVESTLALYRWDGARWVKEPTSRVDAAQNKVTATPNRFSTWAVLGEMDRTYLPLVRR